MRLETTVHITRSAREKLEYASQQSGLTRSRLVVLCVQRAMGEYERLVRHCRCVQYQRKEAGEEWSTLHVTIPAFEHEYLTDLRKFFKRSVSLLVVYAINKYLDTVVYNHDDIGGEKTDNYPFQHHVFCYYLSNDVVCWEIYWGIPPNASEILKRCVVQR